MTLGAYRNVLVWVLRIGAVIILLSTVGTIAGVIQSAPANGVLMTLYSLGQLLLNSLGFLAIAEILALLNKRSSAT